MSSFSNNKEEERVIVTVLGQHPHGTLMCVDPKMEELRTFLHPFCVGFMALGSAALLFGLFGYLVGFRGVFYAAVPILVGLLGFIHFKTHESFLNGDLFFTPMVTVRHMFHGNCLIVVVSAIATIDELYYIGDHPHDSRLPGKFKFYLAFHYLRLFVSIALLALAAFLCTRFKELMTLAEAEDPPAGDSLNCFGPRRVHARCSRQVASRGASTLVRRSTCVHPPLWLSATNRRGARREGGIAAASRSAARTADLNCETDGRGGHGYPQAFCVV